MTSETQRANEATAYQLGWMAYERGDDDACATADDEFCKLAQESGNVGRLIRAYNMGFDDAMYQAMCE